MRIAVCDDEIKDRKIISETLRSTVGECSISEFDNGYELLESHKSLPFDFIILDIIMPRISGIDTAAMLRTTDVHTPVVFVSSSEEFGVQSYRVFAFDYLLKPLDTSQLRACMQRLFKCKKGEECLTVTYCGTDTKILLSNIEYLESNLRKVIFALSGNREIEVVGKLTDYEDFLLSHGFCRCHKSYIVNIEHIDSIDSDVFCLTGGKKIKISRTYLQSAKKAYFDYVFSSGVSL